MTLLGVIAQRILAGEAAGKVNVDMCTGFERRQCAAVCGAQLEASDAFGFNGFAGDLDLKHDFSLHTEVAAEK
jgi:hypothetical protein